MSAGCCPPDSHAGHAADGCPAAVPGAASVVPAACWVGSVGSWAAPVPKGGAEAAAEASKVTVVMVAGVVSITGKVKMEFLV